MISEKALKEFKEIWKEEYGEEITNKYALDRAINVLTFFKNIYRPIEKNWLEKGK
jgi:hypothetical protein